MDNGASTAEPPLILIVDDDEGVRLAVSELIQSVGMDARCFSTPRELLDSMLIDDAGCLILDVRMPGSSGLDLQAHLVTNGMAKSIVFLTGHGDIPMSVQAMKAGAIDFLTKPFRDQTLLDAVMAGVERDSTQRANARITKDYLDRFAGLTPREAQVMSLVAIGRLNKQIAFELGITEITVKLHRSNVMRKMQAGSVGELIRAWELIEPHLPENRQP
jgi:FixJ family two-component response regulator